MNNIVLAFITGLTTGGLSCFAVQGGLLASSLSQNEEEKITEGMHWQKVIMFIVSKLIAYTVLGALLGFLGSIIIISLKVQGWLQILAGLVMLVTSARLLDIHPVFRHFNFQTPKWALKVVKSESKSKDLFAPALLGLSTVLIPCGVTQAMMIVAISSGSVLWGSAIMAAFTLGTSPIFFALGLAAIEMFKRKSLKYIAASAIFVLGIMSLNTGQILRGSPHTLNNYHKVAFGDYATNTNVSFAPIKDGYQEVNVNVDNTSYTPNVTNLKLGLPVKLKFITNNVRSCVRTITIPSENISKVLPLTGEEEIVFTPTKLGSILLSCSMGMYTNEALIVVN